MTAGCAAALPSAALGDPAPASVHLKACKTGTGPDPADRSATFVGRTHSIQGSVRMAMRFRLIERATRHGAAPTRTPDLGSWHTSNDGVKRFTYSQTVNGMTAGDSYRVVVRFRWIDGSGKVIRRARQTSAACVQPGLPNLKVDAIAISRGKSQGTSVYHVKVSNDGQAPVSKVRLDLYADGGVIDSRELKNLLPGEKRTVKMTGPVCHTARAVIDPDNRVAESNKTDNSFTRTC